MDWNGCSTALHSPSIERPLFLKVHCYSSCGPSSATVPRGTPISLRGARTARSGSWQSSKRSARCMSKTMDYILGVSTASPPVTFCMARYGVLWCLGCRRKIRCCSTQFSYTSHTILSCAGFVSNLLQRVSKMASADLAVAPQRLKPCPSQNLFLKQALGNRLWQSKVVDTLKSPKDSRHSVTLTPTGYGCTERNSI